MDLRSSQFVHTVHTAVQDLSLSHTHINRIDQSVFPSVYLTIIYLDLRNWIMENCKIKVFRVS